MGWLSDVWSDFTDWITNAPDPEGFKLSKSGTNEPIPVVYGEQRLGGIRVFKKSSDRSGGPWNDYLHYIFVLCEGEIEEVGAVYFNGVIETDDSWDDRYFHIERFRGTDDQAACQTLVNHNIGWTNQHRLRGLAYVYVRLRQNDDVNKWKGEPEITVQVKGKKVYNYETGVTEYSTQPPYCLADYLTRRRYGRGASETTLNIESFIAAAQRTSTSVSSTETSVVTSVGHISDAVSNWQDLDWSLGGDAWEALGLDSLTNTTTTTATNNHPMMTCNVTLDTGNDLFVNVKELLSGMRGMMPNNDGSLTLTIEDYGDPVFSFDKSNIVGEIKVTTIGRKDKANQVHLTFKNKALEYEEDLVIFPTSDSELYQQWFEEDNYVELPYEIDSLTINNVPEATQMAEIIARLSRDLFTVDLKGDDSTWVVEPGDIVAISDVYHGFESKPFRVMTKTPSSKDGTISYELTEHQNDIYPWTPIAYRQPYPKTGLGNAFNIFPPTGLSVSVDESTVVAKWFASPDSNVNGYKIQVHDIDNAQLIKTVTTVDTKQVFENFGNGNFSVTVYAKSTFGLSDPVTSVFGVDKGVQTPPFEDFDFNTIVYTPRDLRVESYINNIHFKYSLENDFDNATDGPVGPSLTITNVTAGDVYYVWYGNGEVWYLGTTSTGALSNLPEIITQIVLPGRPTNIGDTINALYEGLDNHDDKFIELEDGQAGLLADILKNVSDIAIVDTKTISASAQAGLADAKAVTAVNAIADESYARSLLEERIEAEFEDFGADYVRQADLFTSAGAARATEVTLLRAQMGDSSVQAQINSFKNAQIGYEDENGDWVTGAAIAQSFEELTIDGALGNSLTITQYFAAVEDALGDVSGEIQFVIDADGRTTGVFIRGSSTESSFDVAAENFRVVDDEGYVILGINTDDREMEFSGKMVSAAQDMVGETFMEVKRPDGFGPDNLWYWYGPRLLGSDGKVNLALLTKANAFEWKDIAVNAYFGGSLSAGILKNAARSTDKNLNRTIEVGPFGTNGNTKVVVASVGWTGNYGETNANEPAPDESSLPTPSATMTLYRAVGGSGWTQLASQNVTGTVNISDLSDEPGSPTHWVSQESVGGSITFTDTTNSTADYYYKVVVTNQYRHHMLQFITNQTLSVISSEES